MGRPSKSDQFPGATCRKDRKGNEIWRLRLKGQPEIRLPGGPEDECFRSVYQAAVQRQKGRGEVLDLPGRTQTKTFGHAQRLLESSLEWLAFDEKTQKYNAKLIERFLKMPVDPARSSAVWRDCPVEFLRPSDLRGIITTIYEQTPPTARHLLIAIKKLISSAIAAGWIAEEDDPSLSVKVKKPIAVGSEAWSEEAMAAYEARHEIGSAARTAFVLARWLGCRLQDICRMKWDQLENMEMDGEDGEIELMPAFAFHQSKNKKRNGGKYVVLPITDKLATSLAPLKRAPGKTVLQRFDGEAFSGKSLTGQMAHWARQAGLPAGHTIRGLRRNFAQDLVRSKLDIVAIRDMMGHSDLQTTQIYLQGIRQEDNAREARKLINEREAKRDASKRRANLRVVG